MLVLLESVSLYFGLEGSLHYFENDKSAIEAFKLHCLLLLIVDKVIWKTL